MARSKRLAGIEERWTGAAGPVWRGLAEWRAAHPKATLSEIEEALDNQLDRLRARVLADLALASASADVQDVSGEERPRCERCGVVLQARGQSDRRLLTQGGAAVPLRRTYLACPQCGDGTFPPGR
jgi:hypothetical protein